MSATDHGDRVDGSDAAFDVGLAVDAGVARAFAAGSVDEVEGWLAARSSPPSWFARVIDADLRCRRVDIELGELQSLRHELAAVPGSAPLCWWVDAIMAERMLAAADIAAAAWSVQCLMAVPDEPLAPMPVLYARARLRRIACLAGLFIPGPDGLSSFRDLRDRALEDFSRCGFAEEVLFTRVMTAGVHTMLTGDEPYENLARINEAWRHLRAATGSSWIGPTAFFRAATAFAVGDLATVHECFDEIDAHDSQPVVVACAAFGRALARLVALRGDASALADLDAALSRIAHHTPWYVALFQSVVADVLLSFGTSDAARYVQASLDLPPFAPGEMSTRRILAMRLAMLRGDPPLTADLKSALDELARTRRRRAGALALRVAGDLDRLGDHGDAEVMRAWGRQRLPAPSSWTLWEAVWASVVDDVETESGPTWVLTDGMVSAAVPAGAATEDVAATGVGLMRATSGADLMRAAGGADIMRAEIRVLGPGVELVVAGRPVPLRESAAKLLLVLVLAHPRAVPVSELTAQLWPGIDLDRTRGRLNTVVHRLREALIGTGATVPRRADTVRLEPGGCEIDLLRYRAVLDRGSDPERREALAGVRRNLADSQFPYDEGFLSHRQTFVVDWLAQARALIASGQAHVIDLTDAAAALDLTPDDLTPDDFTR